MACDNVAAARHARQPCCPTRTAHRPGPAAIARRADSGESPSASDRPHSVVSAARAESAQPEQPMNLGRFGIAFGSRRQRRSRRPSVLASRLGSATLHLVRLQRAIGHQRIGRTRLCAERRAPRRTRVTNERRAHPNRAPAETPAGHRASSRSPRSRTSRQASRLESEPRSTAVARAVVAASTERRVARGPARQAAPDTPSSRFSGCRSPGHPIRGGRLGGAIRPLVRQPAKHVHLRQTTDRASQQRRTAPAHRPIDRVRGRRCRASRASGRRSAAAPHRSPRAVLIRLARRAASHSARPPAIASIAATSAGPSSPDVPSAALTSCVSACDEAVLGLRMRTDGQTRTNAVQRGRT